MKNLIRAWTIGIEPWVVLTLLISTKTGVHVQLALRVFTEEFTIGLSHWPLSILKKMK